MTHALKDSPLISVIIRSCNRPKLLEKALRSIVKQSYQSLEIVIVNEGLNSLQALSEQFKAALPNIVLIEEEVELPRGRAAAAQLGLENSHGEYLSFLDDDDWLLPLHFQVLLDSIENSPALAVYSSIDCVPEDDEEHVVYTYRSLYDHNKLYIYNYIPIHAVLFDRVLLDKGVAFSPQFKIYEDWDFWLQVSQHTAFKHIDITTAIYRISLAGSGAHSNQRLQQSSRDALWQKWLDKQPEYFQNDLFLRVIQQETLIDEKTAAIAAQDEHLLGHNQHVANQQDRIDQLEEKLQHQQDIFNDKLSVLRVLENKLEQQKEKLEQQKEKLEQQKEELIVLKVLQERHLDETSQLTSNQLRINEKINYSIIALAIIGCLGAVQISISLFN